MQEYSTCRHCGAGLEGVITVDPSDGLERNWMRCLGDTNHFFPFMPNMSETMAFRARVSHMREGAV